MAREQMICIVTPRADVPVSVQRRIDSMCSAMRCIHFATLALLPPAPESDGGSLLLELVVDEGVRPAEVVDLLLDRGFGVLWRLYGVNWAGPPATNPATKREWLRAFLLKHLSIAACGFVGARDRGVAQVVAENKLFRAARSELRALPAGRREDSASVAQHIAEWAPANGFEWIADAARRSLWRHGTVSDWLRWVLLAGRLVLPLLSGLGLLMILGLVLAELPHLMPAPQDDAVAVLLAALAVLAILLPVVVSALAGVLAISAAFIVLFFFVAALSLTMVIAVFVGDLTVLLCVVELSSLGLLSLLAVGLCALLLAAVAMVLTLRAPPFFPVVAGALFGVVLWLVLTWLTRWIFLLMGSLHCKGLAWTASPSSGLPTKVSWIVAALVVVVGLVAIVIALSTSWLPWLAAYARRNDRPFALPLEAIQQVHPSVDRCEAALNGRTSHMISLTEIRRPYAWHRFWLRGNLLLINLLSDFVFTEGRLGAAEGIKFGHWHIVGGGRRLLFCSNYDGAFGGYLDEFIRGASQGVNLFWKHTELLPRGAARADQPAVTRKRSFPPTRRFVFCGCKCEQPFKTYARDSMLPHLYRFEGYSLSNQDIERATRLRDALHGTRNPTKNDRIARALES